MTRRLGASRESQLHDVYRAHVDAVYSYFAFQLPSEVAEDLTAATFERVVRFWGTYDASRGRVRAWILAIARNVLHDHFHRRPDERLVSLDANPQLVELTAASGDPAARQLRLETIKEWLVLLNPRQREVVVLRFGPDLSPRQIGDLLGLTEANVHQILSRALRRLEYELQAQSRSGEPAGAPAHAGPGREAARLGRPRAPADVRGAGS